MASAGWNKLNLAPLRIHSSKHCITLEITMILVVSLKFTVFQTAAFSTFITTDFTSEVNCFSSWHPLSSTIFPTSPLLFMLQKFFPLLPELHASAFCPETTELSNLKFHAYCSLTTSFSVCFSFSPEHSSNNKQKGIYYTEVGKFLQTPNLSFKSFSLRCFLSFQLKRELHFSVA